METYENIKNLDYNNLFSIYLEYANRTICDESGCTNNSIYNYENYKIPHKCEKHKCKDMIVRLYYTCLVNSCNNSPIYFMKENGQQTTPRILCKDHGLLKFKLFSKNMIKCQIPGCKISNAIFNFDNTNWGLFCKDHKLENMNDRVTAPCFICKSKRSKFKCTDTKCYYCEDCAKNKNINKFHFSLQYCQGQNCAKLATPKVASFGLIGTKKATHCSLCIKDNKGVYVDVSHSRCKCGKRAFLAFADSQKTTHCGDCARLEEKELTNPAHRCNTIDRTTGKKCTVRKHYNFPGTIIPATCKDCAPPGSIIVTNKKCVEVTCNNFADYGFQDTIPIHCKTHALPNMINIYELNKCSIQNCKLQYDYVANGIKTCYMHTPKSITIPQKRMCRLCNYPNIDTDYVCITCKNSNNRIELAIVNQILQNCDYKFIHDKAIAPQGIRPDLLFPVNESSALIVEIDEEDHRRYSFEAELDRIVNIRDTLKYKNFYVIRFNPDVIFDKIRKNKIVVHPQKRFDALMCAIHKYYNALANNQLIGDDHTKIRYKRLFAARQIIM